MRLTTTIVSAVALAWSGAAGAASPCGTNLPDDPATGAVLGHLPYPEASADNLVPAPRGFTKPGCEVLHVDAAAALDRLLADARADPSVGNALYGISCFRSVARQSSIYCSRGRSVAALTARARTSAPPGHSEHATGYTIDFGDRRRRGCEVRSCFAQTGAGRWLAAHAGEYGFELSFPSGNTQGVAWEPWHWRWVGERALAPGAPTARAVFATARRLYASDDPRPDLPPFPPAPVPSEATFAPSPSPPTIAPEPLLPVG